MNEYVVNYLKKDIEVMLSTKQAAGEGGYAHRLLVLSNSSVSDDSESLFHFLTSLFRNETYFTANCKNTRT